MVLIKLCLMTISGIRQAYSSDDHAPARAGHARVLMSRWWVWQTFFYLGWIVLKKKKELSNVIRGGIGSTSGCNLYMGIHNGSKLKLLTAGIDSRLWIKVMAFWSFPICLCREAIRLQCFPPMHYMNEWAWSHVHAHTYVTTFTRFAQIGLWAICLHCMALPCM